jgi:hypothetical protein
MNRDKPNPMSTTRISVAGQECMDRHIAALRSEMARLGYETVGVVVGLLYVDPDTGRAQGCFGCALDEGVELAETPGGPTRKLTYPEFVNDMVEGIKRGVLRGTN